MTEATAVPVAVVMISLNESHNMEAVLDNLQPWAQQIFLVDSYSADATVDIALRRGVHVVQRRFVGFGDQWNFALRELPIRLPWTMKLDPDERLTPELKASITRAVSRAEADAFTLDRRLWFMGKCLPIHQRILRLWRTGTCRFSDVRVNEHPLIDGGRVAHLEGDLEHHDSPSLEHWYDKQNRYSTAEALSIVEGAELSHAAKLLGSAIQRRMWIKKHLHRFPLRFRALFLAHYLGQGAWKGGREGLIWARLRAEVHRMIEYKVLEMSRAGQKASGVLKPTGQPDLRVPQY